MSNKNFTQVTIEGNEAAAHIAYNLSEVIAIYPITPSSPMGEYSDAWSSKNQKNIWGTLPDVTEMQSEGGAAGACHGALQAGALTTTFTASQGLLLMIPNMYKIAGELTPTVFHVSARTLATHALSIFGDHGDVMACRQTGWAMMCSGSVQEVMDLALISHKASLDTRVPFLHYFDGFRTSHEIMKIDRITQDGIKEYIDDELITRFRDLAMTPDKPVLRGTAQNPDVFFQAREACNTFYDNVPAKVEKAMQEYEKISGRSYKLFDYVGHPEAEKVIILMGSGAEAAQEMIEYVQNNTKEKIGIVKVRLFRPFSKKHLAQAIPASTKSIAALDRTKEPGSLGEPLYQDIITAFAEMNSENELPTKAYPTIVGGRYGLSSKEFTPAMVQGIFEELSKDKPKNHFTIGIKDDVTHTSLEFDPSYHTESPDSFRGVFYGLGADGTVGANKNSIKIIGEQTENYAQGYFVYDSKKSGSITQSFLRFGKDKIRSTYLIDKANFVACSVFNFLEKFDVLAKADEKAVFLLNAPFSKEEIWNNIPKDAQQTIIDRNIEFYVIDANKVAGEVGLGTITNTIMQTCFFAISNILPKDDAIKKIKEFIQKSFGTKGEQIVKMNYAAVDNALSNLHKVDYPKDATSKIVRSGNVSDKAPQFVKDFIAPVSQGRGDDLPVSLMPVDGTFPTATTKWEKRNVAQDVPAWDESICIQCGKCSVVCPHAAIRMKVYGEEGLKGAPSTFKSVPAKTKEFEGKNFTLQVAVEDCASCGLCIAACPAKNKTETDRKAINMTNQMSIRENEIQNWDHFLTIPEYDRLALKTQTVKGSQLLEPLFEFSGACSGCGETPYVKLVSQMFGDRMIVANATGCSSIYGGNLPNTPWATNSEGRGPTWSNSLFEDNAEFGMGQRLAVDEKYNQASGLLEQLKGKLGEQLVGEILKADQTEEAEIFAQRKRVKEVRSKLSGDNSFEAKRLNEVADYLVKKSVWIMGGDGWAYDIGYGGLDHVLASGRNVNVLVMDTGAYSNTGGQKSKATPRGAIAKFASQGQSMNKKDLGLISMSYENIYVASIALGANDAHTVKAIKEAEAYNGPSLIIAQSHCIAHGYRLVDGLSHQKMAVQSGLWPLYRYNPELRKEGKNPFQLDSKEPSLDLGEYMYTENRFRALTKSHPDRANDLLELAKQDVKRKWEQYKYLSEQKFES